MNAQTILNRHPRVMQTIWWMAADNNRNLFEVAAEYGHTQAEMRAFQQDFDRHGISVPRPAGWHNFKNTPAPASPSGLGETGRAAVTASTESRISELERVISSLESRLTQIELRGGF